MVAILVIGASTISTSIVAKHGDAAPIRAAPTCRCGSRRRAGARGRGAPRRRSVYRARRSVRRRRRRGRRWRRSSCALRSRRARRRRRPRCRSAAGGGIPMPRSARRPRSRRPQVDRSRRGASGSTAITLSRPTRPPRPPRPPSPPFAPGCACRHRARKRSTGSGRWVGRRRCHGRSSPRRVAHAATGRANARRARSMGGPARLARLTSCRVTTGRSSVVRRTTTVGSSSRVRGVVRRPSTRSTSADIGARSARVTPRGRHRHRPFTTDVSAVVRQRIQLG